MDNKALNKKLFGKKIKDYRERSQLTQFELGERVGISQNFLGDIERGKKLPSISKLILLSNALKVSLDTLFSDSLNNVVSEPEEIYYTDRQLALMHSIIKTINENFNK